MQAWCGAGDRNGGGAFAATIDNGKLCFGLTVANIGKPVAAHIHRGGPKVNGPIVVTLKARATRGRPAAV